MQKQSPKQLLEELFQSRAKEVERFIRRRIHDAEEARDLAQEAFMRILRIERVDFIRRPEHYLMRIAANLSYEYRLKQKHSLIDAGCEVDENTESVEPRAEDQAVIRQEMEALRRALDSLPPNVKAALLWHRRDGLTALQIAERLGVSERMVKKYLQRGVACCWAYIKGSDEDEKGGK